jgi:hypothetical protein
MPRTLADLFAGAVLRWRLNSRIRTKRRARKPAPHPAATRPPAPARGRGDGAQSQPHIKPRSIPVNLDFLAGYRTYVIAIAMLVAGASQLLGVDLPSFDGQSAGHLLMEGLAIIFLRKGMKVGKG